MAAPSLFDYLNDISYSKDYIIDFNDCSNYNQYMINRGLQQHLDTVLLANEMNKRPSLSKELHHDFLFYAVESRKRYGKWSKENTPDLDLIAFIQDKYCINKQHAIEYFELLDKTEVKQLKKLSEQKGGKQ